MQSSVILSGVDDTVIVDGKPGKFVAVVMSFQGTNEEFTWNSATEQQFKQIADAVASSLYSQFKARLEQN